MHKPAVAVFWLEGERWSMARGLNEKSAMKIAKKKD